MTYEDPALQDCYDKGFEDGSQGNEDHNSEMSYGNSEEIEAYEDGVEDGATAAGAQPA
jgi:hypothetical protein